MENKKLTSVSLLEISNKAAFKADFPELMREDWMQLPKRWNGLDLAKTLKEEIYQNYLNCVKEFVPLYVYEDIESICDGLIRVIGYYYSGKPYSAYNSFNRSVMKILNENMFTIYNKGSSFGAGRLKLFRLRNLSENNATTRKDIFHTPYSKRSKVASCRYSIAGYPSLYLSTSLKLCNTEVNLLPSNQFSIASRFELFENMFDYKNGMKRFEVLELAIKPSDFGLDRDNIINSNRVFSRDYLESAETKVKYLYWYPLIAASSFIRNNKSDPFSSEHIIPQLFMQWIRTEDFREKNESYYGIRYFSCASESASDMGFNYVFPTSGRTDNKYNDYCFVLSDIFRLTQPVYCHEYRSIYECEEALIRENDLREI